MILPFDLPNSNLISYSSSSFLASSFFTTVAISLVDCTNASYSFADKSPNRLRASLPIKGSPRLSSFSETSTKLSRGVPSSI